ncbi:ECF transporter S component [Camelliibacillus cellulosilyticus]|uniref:Riboflavin transporter n=1 Tax=Camelliibacillus cellulosilyticus TaxID=2174486 RepID=A0ABV9GRP0_9BACL
MKQASLRKNITVAILSAIAFLIMYIAFPLPLFPVFLQLDLSDIPAIIGAVLYGPLAGIIIEAIKNLLHYLIAGSATGVPVGEVANFLAGGLFIVTGTFLYRKRKTILSLIIGMVIGTLVMAVVMAIANYYIIFPSYAYFLGFSTDKMIELSKAANHSIHDLVTLIVLGVLPFNIIKGLIVSVIVVPIYMRLKPRLRANV